MNSEVCGVGDSRRSTLDTHSCPRARLGAVGAFRVSSWTARWRRRRGRVRRARGARPAVRGGPGERLRGLAHVLPVRQGCVGGNPTTALGELNATSFLGKHDISVSAWGKSVKERSPLFKEEFEKFMRIERVREALAADLGPETPRPRASNGDESVVGVSNDASPRLAASQGARAHGPRRSLRRAAAPRRVVAARRDGVFDGFLPNGAAPAPAEPAPAEPAVSAAFHRERSSRTSTGSRRCFWICEPRWTRSRPRAYSRRGAPSSARTRDWKPRSPEWTPWWRRSRGRDDERRDATRDESGVRERDDTTKRVTVVTVCRT